MAEVEAPWLNGGERGILTHFGHVPDAEFDEEKLARRVLEFPNTGSENWYCASAVTLAAAYLNPVRLAAPDLYEALRRLLNQATNYDGDQDIYNAAINRARVALAKVSPQAVSENGNVQGVK